MKIALSEGVIEDIFSVKMILPKVQGQPGRTDGLGELPPLESDGLGGAAGDDTVASDGDLAEDGESVSGYEIELRVAQFGVRDELSKAPVVTRQVLLESVLAP